jgi:glycosyltransferase involved in cell wall biosynthesis
MKKILIYFPQNIAPIIMANQQRVFDKINYLAKSNSVTCISIINNEEEKKASEKLLGNIAELYFIKRPPIFSVYGVILRFLWQTGNFLGIAPIDYLRTNGHWVNKVFRTVRNNGLKFDIIICDYWFGATVFKYFNDGIKVIDTHNVLSQKRELELSQFGGTLSSKKSIENYKQLESKYLNQADILIAISKLDLDFYERNFKKDIKKILIPIGIDFNKFNSYQLDNKNDNVILFYGNLGSSQNINALERLWQNIFPLIKHKIPDAQLLILGSNPTDKIRSLEQYDYVTVTGYVDVPFNYIKKASVFILPLMTGGGFRGRIVEVMGLGVPSIGTHNAFDCLDMVNEKHGFIADDDTNIADIAIKLLSDKSYWGMISENSKKFIREEYSFESTYDKLDEIVNSVYRN